MLEKGVYRNCDDWGAGNSALASLQPVLQVRSEGGASGRAGLGAGGGALTPGDWRAAARVRDFETRGAKARGWFPPYVLKL